jgi:hypothetical protein
LVEGFAGSAFIRFDVRVLELKHPIIIGFHVSNVSFTVFGMVDDLLPTIGKPTLPSAVPFRFGLPPPIALETPAMSPVPNSDFPAPCNHGTSAARALARKIGLSFLALAVHESELHVTMPVCRCWHMAVTDVVTAVRTPGSQSFVMNRLNAPSRPRRWKRKASRPQAESAPGSDEEIRPTVGSTDAPTASASGPRDAAALYAQHRAEGLIL